MPEKPFPELSPRHRLAIGTTLTILDEALCEFERWAQGRKARSVLYAERNDLSPEQRRGIVREIAAMRDTLRELREDLELQGKTEDAKNAISSRCSVLWTHLVELESRRLERYGETPSGFDLYFDPKVAQLIEHLQNTVKVIQKKLTSKDSVRSIQRNLCVAHPTPACHVEVSVVIRHHEYA